MTITELPVWTTRPEHRADYESTLLARERRLNRLISSGRLLEAFVKFYEHGTVGGPKTPRQVVLRFFEWADTFIGTVPLRSVASERVSYSEWVRVEGCEGSTEAKVFVIVREWRAGRVRLERVCRAVPSDTAPSLACI